MSRSRMRCRWDRMACSSCATPSALKVFMCTQTVQTPAGTARNRHSCCGTHNMPWPSRWRSGNRPSEMVRTPRRRRTSTVVPSNEWAGATHAPGTTSSLSKIRRAASSFRCCSSRGRPANSLYLLIPTSPARFVTYRCWYPWIPMVHPQDCHLLTRSQNPGSGGSTISRGSRLSGTTAAIGLIRASTRTASMRSQADLRIVGQRSSNLSRYVALIGDAHASFRSGGPRGASRDEIRAETRIELARLRQILEDRRPSGRVVREAGPPHLLRVEQVPPVDHDRVEHDLFQQAQVEPPKLIPLGCHDQAVSTGRRLERTQGDLEFRQLGPRRISGLRIVANHVGAGREESSGESQRR